MKQFFEQLPSELGESARIDGASEFKIFMKVYFPLAKPALTTLGIMTFQSGWNAFMWPLIVLNSDEMKTVQVGLAAFQYNYSTNYGPLMAGTILATLPVLSTIHNGPTKVCSRISRGRNKIKGVGNEMKKFFKIA